MDKDPNVYKFGHFSLIKSPSWKQLLGVGNRYINPISPISLSDNSTISLTNILVPFGGLATLQLSSYSQPKSENRIFAKTQNGHQSFGLASKIFCQKTKIAHFCELLEERKNWDLCDQNLVRYDHVLFRLFLLFVIC